jgi:hypothetical protein
MGPRRSAEAAHTRRAEASTAASRIPHSLLTQRVVPRLSADKAHGLSQKCNQTRGFCVVFSEMDPSQRRFLVAMTLVALLAGVAQALTGVSELVLYLTPCFLLGALLMCGRFVAEDRIVRRWRAALPHVRRRLEAMRPRPLARGLVTSLLERSPLAERGPPAVLAPS